MDAPPHAPASKKVQEAEIPYAEEQHGVRLRTTAVSARTDTLSAARPLLRNRISSPLTALADRCGNLRASVRKIYG